MAQNRKVTQALKADILNACKIGLNEELDDPGTTLGKRGIRRITGEGPDGLMVVMEDGRYFNITVKEVM